LVALSLGSSLPQRWQGSLSVFKFQSVLTAG
jgi:hypothetical protein